MPPPCSDHCCRTPAGCCCCCCCWGPPAAMANCLALPAAGWDLDVIKVTVSACVNWVDFLYDVHIFSHLGHMFKLLWNRTVQHVHNNVHKVKRSFHVAADSNPSVGVCHLSCSSRKAHQAAASCSHSSFLSWSTLMCWMAAQNTLRRRCNSWICSFPNFSEKEQKWKQNWLFH